VILNTKKDRNIDFQLKICYNIEGKIHIRAETNNLWNE
jgi:hypothetical protein